MTIKYLKKAIKYPSTDDTKCSGNFKRFRKKKRTRDIRNFKKI